ncbi:MAG: uroporphyrinogen-III synthase [Acidobacteria bacterium]|nr:uroporphyrinogen-III synthase [Acidobacteriota bacterium]
MNSVAEKLFASDALSGKTVFAAASAKLLPELAAGLRALGADVLPVAVLDAEEIEDNTALDRAIANINKYDWIIFTSAWGVSFFAERLTRIFHGDSAPVKPANGAACLPKICVIGIATAAAAEKHGFPITLTADEFTAEGVMQSLELYHGGAKNLRGLGVLIPRALEAREFLPAALATAGCRVDTIPCYKTVRPEPDAELSARLRNETPDLIVFTSTKAMRNFLKTVVTAAGETTARRFLREAIAAVIGPVTAGALEAEGKSAEIIPPESTVHALLAAIAGFFKNR